MKQNFPMRLGALFLSLALCLSLLPGAAQAAEPDGSIAGIPEGMTIEGTVVTKYEGTAADLAIPEGVTGIGNNAFWKNSSLKAITLPSTLTAIGNSAFGYTGLTQVTIPASVTTIGDGAFFGTGSLTGLVFDGESQLLSIGENAFYSSALTSVTVPASVTTIGGSAFERCKDLTQVTVNGTVVGESMFYMSGVETANLPNVETVGQSAFAGCTALSELSMPNVKQIGSSAFQSTKLTEFTLPDTVESTGSSILYGANITRLTVFLGTLLEEGVDPAAFLNAFYNADPYENNTQIILTGVDQDVTLLENGLKANGRELQFTTAMYQAFLVTDVQATAGTVTNQSGIEVNVNNKPLQTGGAMPAAADTDAYLYHLALSCDAGGETGILLQPAFGNLTGEYTAAVDHTVSSVTLTAIPSDSGAAVAVTVNGTPVAAGAGHMTELTLDMGENAIAITVTAPDGTAAKTYTLTVSRNEASPENLQISNAEELMAFAAAVNSGRYEDTSDMLVELTADIDMSGLDWTPIGDQGEYYFEGVFDGNGCTIRNLTLDAQKGDYLGLFGAAANTTIRDVHVTGTLHNAVSTTQKSIGGIIGLAVSCEIIGCTAEFSVTCAEGATLGMTVGGIAGEADYSRIENCASDTAITGSAFGFWGGITGAAVGSDLVSCVNRGGITIPGTNGYLYAGGIAGTAQKGATISDCINEGDITLSAEGSVNRTVGGVCGQLLSSTVSRCTNNGDVSAMAYHAAGIAASVSTSSGQDPSAVISCLNNGAVTSGAASGYAAGIAAAVSGSSGIEACVSLGHVNGATAHAIAAYNSNGSFNGNYYDSAITSVGTIPDAVTEGSTGKAAAELHTQGFVDEVNGQGGQFRLDQDGRLEVIPPFYTLIVEGSEAEDTGAGTYEAGQQVAVDAGTKPGYQFAGWSAPAGSFADATSAQTTFTMPAESVVVTASFTEISKGGGGGTSAYRVTVEASAHGTVESNRTSAGRGTAVTLTVTPDKGYELDSLSVADSRGNGIGLSDQGSGKFTFTMPGGPVTVTAVFVQTDSVSDCPRDARCPMYDFDDLNRGAWYHDGVHSCLANGLMNGVDDRRFAPEGTMTRAQLVTILWRMEDCPVSDYLMGFEDVSSTAYYGEAVCWAASEGIVSGYGNGRFGPDDAVTREQFAAILYRCVRHKGYDTTQGGMAIREYADYEQISGYALAAMDWAVAEGIVNGASPTALYPQGTAVRAQAAAMLQRFCEQYGAVSQ